ncbi:MAG: 4-hydroxybenzoate octaprenyltransferase [Gammaproteobacteria bacterium]|jgi:4-hydroxybenzoate polyprenyltransferase
MNTTTLQTDSSQRLLQLALLMRLDKPVGTYLLLWPTLWALWIAGDGKPDTYLTLVFVVGVILMRAAGCIVNDFADRNIDGFVTRTKSRPLATGAVSSNLALWLFVVLCLIAFGMVLTLNVLTIGLSIGAMILAVTYPYMKRHTYMPQAFLGLAFGWAVPMAFAAQANALPDVAWLLLTATVLWATAYDTMYAMVDRDDDLQIGVKSTAILFGEADRVIIGVIQATFILTMMIVGNKLELGLFYYLGLSVSTGLLVYQQYLIRDREPNLCFKAFLNNHWVGFAIFVGLLLNYLFTG